MTMQITDEMIEAANDAYEQWQPRGVHGQELSVWARGKMRAALEAALAVAPTPDPAEDAEFEQALLSYFAIAGGVALDQKKWAEGYTAPEVIEQGTTYYKTEIERRFNVILALHRQARHAGLRELRMEIDDLTRPYLDKPLATDPRDPHLVEFTSYRAIRFRIDAMLNGGDDDQTG